MASGQVSPKVGKVVDIPDIAPTIGTATDAGTGTGVNVEFTAPSITTGGPIFYYKATSNPGSFTGTSSSSPTRVNGLTQGTSYTFTVVGVNGTGEGPSSAASNSVAPILPTAYESIATVTVGASPSVTFNSIPSTYQNLQVRWTATHADDGSGTTTFDLRFNGDTGSSNYFSTYLRLYPGGVDSATFANQGYMRAMGWLREPPYVSSGIIDINDYAVANKRKIVKSLSGAVETLSPNGRVSLSGGAWVNTSSAITSITIMCAGGSNNFSNGTFSLYGIKGS
jgi:hypothetical protein